MKKNDAFRRAAALMAALSITVSLAAPAFAGTYYIDEGDITIIKNEDGSQTIQQQGKADQRDEEGDETIITTHITTQESDLEGLAAEDSGFSPVVEDNYQTAPPARHESAEQQPQQAASTAADARHESAEQQPQQAASTAADARHESAEQQPQQAAPTSVNEKFWKNTITVINNFANTALKLTLKNVKIDVSDTGNWSGETGKAALSVQGKGNVEIELDGDNELKSGHYRAGLEKTSTGTLTLKDDNKGDDNKEAGSLTATSRNDGAGIGGGAYGEGNNITITGGTVTAAGGSQAAGIGGGAHGEGNNIIITGGTVTAAGGSWGAGIGGGAWGNGEDITINGGRVTATGGYEGAGIGGGKVGSGKNIIINGGSVIAASREDGAGIGGGAWGIGYDITINDGTVNAAGGKDGGAGIGGGYYGSGKKIIINGGSVNATGGDCGAGIGSGGSSKYSSGEDITINGGRVTARGGENGAGIGGGYYGSGKKITINGGTVNAAGGVCGAGIGGGATGSGSNVTVSGAAQVTAKAGKRNGSYGAGATIGNGGNETGGQPVDGDEIQADISSVTTGYIHHILYEQDGTTIKREWWEPVRTQPTPDGESLDLHVETLEGAPLLFNTRQQGSTLRVTTDNLAARLHGTRQALETLREQGVEQIQFVTTLKTTTLSVEDLLAEGGSWFALEHNGLVSRQLSAAQAESLKCRMR